MPSKKAFFAKKENNDAKKKGSQKRKKGDKAIINDIKAKKSKFDNEEITSESENEEVVKEVESEESDHETAQEKRTRLAKKMLEDIKETVSQEDDEVNQYLKSQVLDSCGKLFHQVADEYECPIKDNIKLCTWSGLGIVTCIAASSDSRFIFSGCKNGHIIKWSLPDCKKVGIIKRVQKKSGDEEIIGHSKEVKCLALSKDGKYLASGGCEQFVYIWNPETMTHVHTFKGHRSAVTCLAFQIGTHMLFSGSQDKSIKRWNVDEMAYAETLFGHEDAIMSIDCSAQERAISSGGRDNSVRFWKIPEESHLLFGGTMCNIDCVKFIDNRHFLSASCDNKLTLWATDSRKPRTVINGAHGTSQQWISSIATLKQHDIVASGAYDGELKFWKVGADLRSLEFLFSTQLEGYLNSLQFTDDGQCIVVGIGREHRLGRWFEPIKTARNSVAIIKLNKKNSPITNGN